MAIDLSYPAITSLFQQHMKSGTETRAFLVWFLENYYRLDDLEIYDSVCDGKADKGIDGIYVDHGLRQIDFFQITLVKAEEKTMGDAKIKQFAGAITQFRTKAAAETVLAVASPELRAIAERVDLVKCIELGYELRGVFITNAVADASATTFLATQTGLVLYDGLRLKNELVTIDKTGPIATEIEFDVSGVPSLPFPIGTDLKMVIAPIAAQELVRMEGIANGDLFTWNVRQWLGKKTTVNKSVADSIKRQEEHILFPAFHNGITILCRNLDYTNARISISGYAVVNGCQSITSLFQNRQDITSDLRILTKFIEIEPDSDLATKITDHTNNQNGTTARDLQSNSKVQTRLQSEIHAKYPEYRYRIKRGEHPEWPKNTVIDNELLARIILAFDLDKSEAWSQNYKLFDDLHGEIFARPGMTADRAVFLYDTYVTVQEKLSILDDQAFAEYTLTRWLTMLLVREALMTDPKGKDLCRNPAAFFSNPNGRRRVNECVAHVAQNVVRVLNGEVKRRQKAVEFFDYKKDLKNKEYVTTMCATIITAYEIILDSAHTDSFRKKWDDGGAISPPTP